MLGININVFKIIKTQYFMSSAGALPIKTKPSTVAVGKAEAEIQAKQANVKDLKNIDIDSQHLNYEISSIPCESW